jgi:hypothetical protein
MTLDKDLYNEINEYCKINSLKTRDFIHKLLKEAFLVQKYGDSPFNDKTTHKIESVVLVADKVLANGRVFPKETVENAIKKFSEENKIEKPSLDCGDNIKVPVEYLPQVDDLPKTTDCVSINKTDEENVTVVSNATKEEQPKVRKKRKLS